MSITLLYFRNSVNTRMAHHKPVERTDPARIYVIDDFIPDYDYTQESYQHWSKQYTSNYQRPDGQHIGISLRRSGDNTREKLVPMMSSLLDNMPRACAMLGLPAIDRIISTALLVSEVGDDFHSKMHTDDSSPAKMGYTFSYHWLGTEGCGGTVWFNDLNATNEIHRVDFKPNRLVVFYSKFPHTGYARSGQRSLLSAFAVLKNS